MTYYTTLRRAVAYNVIACGLMAMALGGLVAALIYAMTQHNIGGVFLFFGAVGLALLGELFHSRARTLLLHPTEVHTEADK